VDVLYSTPNCGPEPVPYLSVSILAAPIAPKNHSSETATPEGQLKVKVSESPEPLTATFSKLQFPEKSSSQSSSTPV